MLFKNTFLVLMAATISALVNASPISTDSALAIFPRDLIKDCDEDITRESRTTPYSPPVDDCQQLYTRLNTATAGVWSTLFPLTTKSTVLANYGNCSFGAYISGGSVTSGAMGNEDIMNRISFAIDFYRSPEGTVGADGTTTCVANSGGKVPVTWGIYGL
jgi:Pathogen effector